MPDPKRTAFKAPFAVGPEPAATSSPYFSVSEAGATSMTAVTASVSLTVDDILIEADAFSVGAPGATSHKIKITVDGTDYWIPASDASSV